MQRWKSLLLKSAGFGAGFALVLSVILGVSTWYASRPKPPKPWNTSALVAVGPPAFHVSEDGKKLLLGYTLENKTDTDYTQSSRSDLKVLARFTDGSISQPLGQDQTTVHVPIFIPSKQKARLEIDTVLPNLPMKLPSDSDDTYHEKLRMQLNERYNTFTGLVIFDELNRYQVNLTKWAATKPQQ